MPFQLSGGDRKIMLVAGVVFAVLIAAAALLLPPDSDAIAAPTTWSTDSAGAKAAFLLLKEMGYPVRRYEDSPTELPKAVAALAASEASASRNAARVNATLILAEPSMAAGREELKALHQFVQDGGRLIAIGSTVSMMLPGMSPETPLETPSGGGAVIRPSPVEVMAWDKFPALAPTDITRAAPQITMAPRAYWNSPDAALALYGKMGKTGQMGQMGREDRAVVVRYPYGEGTVLWWAAATPLTNAGLKEPGNLEFFISCLGGRENPILWDEYFHGYRRSGGDSSEVRLFAILLIQAGLLGLAAVWTFSRRSGPVRQPLPESRLSPLEFVETLGNLYHRAKAASVVVDIYHQRFMYWLTRRLGMPRDATFDRIGQAMRSRWDFHTENGKDAADVAALAGILKECAAARRQPNLSPKRALTIVRALHDYAAKLKLFPGAR
ncbi:MAG: DUF4350 domain-containing protein [Acidobacteriota bacterium]|jgi:hypothetical protein|nr:DUF4350 domain-containing protein [Acidobacteriota bacterium]